MKPLLAAIRFLTIVPLPASWETDEDDLARSLSWFPVVGLLIGLAASGLTAALAREFPPLVSAVVLVIVLAGVSQALHLDGLSDTADGFLSSRPRERVLEIMRDSHIGAMGVVSIVLILLLKVASLGSMPTGDLWRAAVLMPVAGRCAILVQMAMLPYARPEGGLASIFYRGGRTGCAIGAVAALGLVGFLAARWAGLSAAGVTLVLVAVFSAYSYRRIGGATGDTLGASCELAEAATALTMAGWYGGHG
jgi:adenosylcobinamide-GDP ribazoletransferase